MTILKREFFDRTTKSGAEAALNKLKNLADNGPLTYQFSLKINESDWQIAHATGLARTLICKDVGCENNPNFKRPEKTEQKTSSIGILAEYAVGRLITKALKIPLTLVATGALKEADFLLDGLKFDIKASAESAKFLYINADAHRNTDKRPDHYLIYRIARDDTADIYTISASAVDNAKLLRVYSECYQIPWPRLIQFEDELLEEAA